MIWLKDAYDEYVVVWETGPFEIFPGLPLATAFLGVYKPYEDDDDYYLETKIVPFCDNLQESIHTEDHDWFGWFDMSGVVENNGGPQFYEDPNELARDGRAFFQDILEERPEWFVNWYVRLFNDDSFDDNEW